MADVKTIRQERAERQKAWRDAQRKAGYRRLDIWLDPKTWRKLYPHLREQIRDTHPGAAVTEFLDTLEMVTER
ncbi:hypothetical protein [Methylococcus sp. EFPC2]|uniref:hypothetical protein n=1 Tax=Methylococcus sp. EFPC2 TaxID=2812648 RepID=UPI001966EC73|nr:hypothetical protein [Methylococcus sp. EFPC2]QSA97734.1 hypothetical protein JWZ97_02560 [Methylococcus sp. EFPC2]